MKRPSDDDGDRPSTPDSNVEASLSAFLRRNPRFFIYLVIAFAVIVIIAFLIAKFSGAASQ
jgi:hypothetical protein